MWHQVPGLEWSACQAMTANTYQVLAVACQALSPSFICFNSFTPHSTWPRKTLAPVVLSQALHFAKQWLLASFLAFLVVPSIPGTGLHLSSRTGCHSEGFLKPGTVTTDVTEQKSFSSNLDFGTILDFWKSTNSSTESFCMSSSQLPLTLILCINMVHLSKAGSGHSYAIS